MTCAPSEDSDQPGQTGHIVGFVIRQLSEDTDQPGRTGHFVGFVMRQLKLNLPFTFQSHQNHSSFLHKTVGAALQSLQPVSVTSNKIVDYGYILGLYTIIVII